MTGKTRNSMAAIMTVLVTVVMWMTAAIGVIVLLAGGTELISMLSGNAVSIGVFKVDDHAFTPPQLTASLIALAFLVGSIVFICFQLRRILLTLVDGDPFVAENANRLTRIAVALAVTELARYAIKFATKAASPETSIVLKIDLLPWASVAAIFILSQVFREGTRLRDEEKMTI